MFWIFQDHTKAWRKKAYAWEKSFISVSDLPRLHKVAGQRAYTEMKGIDSVIKKQRAK